MTRSWWWWAPWCQCVGHDPRRMAGEHFMCVRCGKWWWDE